MYSRIRASRPPPIMAIKTVIPNRHGANSNWHLKKCRGGSPLLSAPYLVGTLTSRGLFLKYELFIISSFFGIVINEMFLEGNLVIGQLLLYVYQVLCVPHACTSTKSWSSVLLFIIFRLETIIPGATSCSI